MPPPDQHAIRPADTDANPNQPKAAAIGTDESASGQYLRPKDGTLLAMAFKIGTYKGKSDGTLQLRVCQEDACSSSTTELAGAENNKDLVFALRQPLVTIKNTPLEWTLTKIGGTHKVALWTYPASNASGNVKVVDQTLLRTPRISLRYADK